jgi:integrase
LPAKFIIWYLDKLPPTVARTTLNALRHVMQFAVAADMIPSDPTLGIKIRLPKSDGHHTWSEDEIAIYEAKHAIGTKARLALALALYTAQRRSDIIRMGRQHIRDGLLSVKQQKTGAQLSIPVHSELRAIMDATPSDNLTLLTTATGKQYHANDLSIDFAEWRDQAKLPAECTLHGLRKAACRRLAEAGCSAHEIMAISGHKTLKEVERYTAAVNQVKMAHTAMARTI